MTGAPPPGYLGAGGPLKRGPAPELVEAGYALELADDPEIAGHVDLDEVLRPERALGAVDALVDRVLGE